jgi:hypothetical protein
MESGQFPPAGKSSQAEGGGGGGGFGGGAVAEKYVFNVNIQVVCKHKF